MLGTRPSCEPKEEMERRLAEERALRQQQEQRELEAAAQAAAQLRQQEAAAQAAAQLKAQELQAQQQAAAQRQAEQQAAAQRQAEMAAQQQELQTQQSLNSQMSNLSVNTQPAPQPTNGPMQQLNVTLPNNIKPGETFQIRTPQGALVNVQCPVGKYGGQTITVNVPTTTCDISSSYSENAGTTSGSSSTFTRDLLDQDNLDQDNLDLHKVVPHL